MQRFQALYMLQSPLVNPLVKLSKFSITNNVLYDPNKNKYQESKMLFFADKVPQKKNLSIKPKTITEIKKL
jgi:hypothetical protein